MSSRLSLFIYSSLNNSPRSHGLSMVRYCELHTVRYLILAWPSWYRCQTKSKVKVKVVIYSLISPKAYRTLHQLTPGIGTHSSTVSFSQGEYSAFSAAVAIHTVPILRSTWYPLFVGWTEAVWIQSLPKAFTHDQRCVNRTADPQISGPMP